MEPRASWTLPGIELRFIGLYVYSPIVARQQLGKHVSAAKKNCWSFRFLCGQCNIKGDSVGLSVYPSVFSRRRLSKHVPAATKNCWRHRFVCGPCRIKKIMRLILPRTPCTQTFTINNTLCQWINISNASYVKNLIIMHIHIFITRGEQWFSGHITHVSLFLCSYSISGLNAMFVREPINLRVYPHAKYKTIDYCLTTQSCM
jgi:hypothetical protein